MHRHTPSLLLVVAFGLAACFESGGGGKDDDSASDSGTDGGTDTETDGGTDSETDTDAAGPWVFHDTVPGEFTRVDRAGMPVVSTVLIQSKDAYNAGSPADDVLGTFVQELVDGIGALHRILDDDLFGLGLTRCSGAGSLVGTCIGTAAPLVVPDTIKIDPPNPAGFPNGRLLTDPVIDLTLGILLLETADGTHPVDLFATLPLNPPANDVAFQAAFPYLAPPH